MIARGDVCWADFGDPRGSEPGKRRPAIVVQADSFNASSINTVVVVPLTSNTALAAMPGNVFVPATSAGLDRDSVANVSQVCVVSREYLDDAVAALPRDLLDALSDGVRLVLGL